VFVSFLGLFSVRDDVGVSLAPEMLYLFIYLFIYLCISHIFGRYEMSFLVYLICGSLECEFWISDFV
jgi:hypothetical protein